MFESLLSGLTHFIIHPSHDTPELRAYVRDSGIQVIGFRALQELMPARSGE